MNPNPINLTLPLKQITCSNCRWSRSCWPSGVSHTLGEALRQIIQTGRPVPAGTTLFRQGNNLSSLYIVRLGSVKTYVTESDGLEQIVNFNLPGEALGLDAVGQNTYASTAETLESTVVCVLPYAQLTELWESVPSLRLDMFRHLAGELAHQHTLLLSIAQRDAEARLAMFLLGLSERFRRRGLPSNEFNLSMKRSEIGNYLGLNQETVSRILTRFQQAKLVSVNYKNIRLDNIPGLKTMAKRGTP